MLDTSATLPFLWTTHTQPTHIHLVPLLSLPYFSSLHPPMLVCVHYLPMLHKLPESAATFSALLTKEQLELHQLHIQTASVDDSTLVRYGNTMKNFVIWCANMQLDTTAAAALLWCTELSKTRQLMPSTLDQYLSHLESFAELGIFTANTMRSRQSRRFIKGLYKLTNYAPIKRVLQPHVMLHLYSITCPSLMEVAILFQIATGLRGGQMVLITPNHIINKIYQVVPPYKHKKTSTMLSLEHVPPSIVTNFLHFAKAATKPILAMSGDQYKKKFTTTLLKLGYHLTSHAARRAFASIQNFHKVPIALIGAFLLHANPMTTTPTYIFDISVDEALIVLQHPELFIPIKQSLLVSSVTTLHR